MTQSQFVERSSKTVERPPQAPAPAPPKTVVPWIQWLGFATILVVVGAVLWILSGPDDTSFQYAEDLRFERIGASPIVLDRSWEMAESIHMQTLNPLPRDGSWEAAEALYMASLAPLVDTSWETAEYLHMITLAPGAPVLDSWEYAEMLRFQRILERAEA